MSATPLLAVEQLHYVVGDKTPLTILQDISLAVREHEFVCIVGASGCGKTTLLRLLGGLLQPTQGQVTFRGQPVTGPDRALAIVFQDYAKALLPWRTVAGNVELALELRARAAQRAAGDHPTACWRRSGSPTAPTRFRCSCPAACSSACRSRAASPRRRRCC